MWLYEKILTMTENVEEKKAEEPQKAAETPAVNPLEKSVEFTVPAAELTSGIEASLKRYAKKAKIAGFRPGHVPFETVRAMYGHDAYVETLNGLIEREFEKAVKAANLQMVGMPEIVPVKTAEGEDLKFKATVECFPEFELPALDSLELKRYVCPLTDAEVNQTIDVMRKQRATFTVEEGRKAADTDICTINFTGTKDGVAFEGGTARDFRMTLGAGRMLPEFENAVRGMAAGEKKTFKLTFPADYFSKDLAGQTVDFEVELTKLEKEVLPELNEEFAKSVGQDSVEALKKEVGVNLEREVKARLLARTKAETMAAFAGLAPFPAPKAMLKEEEERLAKQAQERMVAQFGIDAKKAPKLPLEVFEKDAKQRVLLGFLVAKLIEVAKINVTREDLEAFAAELSASYEEPEKVKEYYLKDRAQFEMLTNVLVENKVVDYILSKAKTTEETLPFDKLMQA